MPCNFKPWLHCWGLIVYNRYYMKNIKIGIDIDGVIVDLVSSMLPLLSKYCGRSVCYSDIRCFDIGKALKIEDKMEDIWTEVDNGNILRVAPPIKGAIIGLSELSEHDIWLVTSRPKSSRSDTELWLRENRVEFDKLKFVDTGDKVPVVRALDVFLEDSLETACAVAEAGIDSLLFDQPWNQCSKLPRRCERVKDWKDVGMYIKMLEKTSDEDLTPPPSRL
jgi:uncharacterized HAD superfamily protein